MFSPQRMTGSQPTVWNKRTADQEGDHDRDNEQPVTTSSLRKELGPEKMISVPISR